MVVAPAAELTDLPRRYQLCRRYTSFARRLGETPYFSLIDPASYGASILKQLPRTALPWKSFSVDPRNATHRDLIRTTSFIS